MEGGADYRIAFASTGEYIDQHFGSALYFQVYDIAGKEHNHLETRKTQGKCQGHCEGGFSHLLEILNDCDAVFVSKIGPAAAEFMIGKGKRVFEASGSIEAIIAKLKEEHFLDGG
jgi:predicted Fe-Mo cluster-binding NifX family protein